MIAEVVGYRFVCDMYGCDMSPQDDGDFFAHTTQDAAREEAEGQEWISDGERYFCLDHPLAFASQMETEGEDGTPGWDEGELPASYPAVLLDDFGDDGTLHIARSRSEFLWMLNVLRQA